MRLLFFTFVFALLYSSAAAQENQSRQSKDKAFIIGQTSPEQAIGILGKPKSDKTEKIDILYVDAWVDDKFKKEKYRVLFFDRFEDLGAVKLTFFNEKLVALSFLLEKELRARRLPGIYKVQFVPVFNEFGIKGSVGEFDRRTKDVSSANFPRNYYLVGTSKTSALVAKVFSGGESDDYYLRERNTGGEIKSRPRRLTGKVTELQILSRAILK